MGGIVLFGAASVVALGAGLFEWALVGFRREAVSDFLPYLIAMLGLSGLSMLCLMMRQMFRANVRTVDLLITLEKRLEEHSQASVRRHRTHERIAAVFDRMGQKNVGNGHFEESSTSSQSPADLKSL